MKARDLFLTFEKRRHLNSEAKRAIARRALDMVGPEEEIFLGAGTTVAQFGEELARSGKHFMLRIWTNNLFVVSLWLAKYEAMFSENFVGITAGEVSRKNLSIVNLVAAFSRIEKAVIGTPGITAKGLLSDDIYTVQQTEFLIRKVRRVIILADSSKVGRECTYTSRAMRMIRLDIKAGREYTLVTDAGAASGQARETVERLRESGIHVEMV